MTRRVRPSSRPGAMLAAGGPRAAAWARSALPAALLLAAGSPTYAGQPPASGASAASQPAGKSAGPPTRYLPDRFAGRAGQYYRIVWGIDSPSVKLTESGEMIRFSWRVVDPEKAKALSDKNAEPSLIDPAARVSLVVPQMEKIGQLRQSQTPEAGKSYWMAFSNKGQMVKRGHRVVVVIGGFRADGLVVD